MVQNPPQTPRAEPPASFEVIPFAERSTEILELRRLALSTANQIAPDTPTSEMYDPRDLRAKIGIAEIEGRLIGSARLAPPLEGSVLHHSNRCIEPVVGLPPSAEYLELSKVCVHPAHQGQGILWYLVALMLITARKEGRPYLLGGVNPSMWQFWKRCGFRKIGTNYVGPNAPDIEYSLVLLDVEEVLAGRGISPKLAAALSLLLAGA